MATIDDVIAWAHSLPPWQGDAVRRVLVAGEKPLSETDMSELLALAKFELKLAPAPESITPSPPAVGAFSGAVATATIVKLLSIQDVRHVNIIQAGQSQPFSAHGITVIYGDNGSGKSGYSRILKLACMARDKDEIILPDVFATAPVGIPTATLKILQDTQEKEIVWTQGNPTDPVLTNIIVFDGRCARVITDERNEISYLPYGSDVFQKAADIVIKIKEDLLAEKIILVPLQDSAVIPGTASALFLKSLSDSIKDDMIEAATTWSPQVETELTMLEELVRASDSARATQEILRLNKFKGRVNVASEAVSSLDAKCAALTNERAEQILTELKAATLAYETAKAERQAGEPLKGVASTNQWEILYNAAKNYSEEIAYPREPFPKVNSAVCVLCQQPLSAVATARFLRFKKYMEDATSKSLAIRRSALNSFSDMIDALSPLIGAVLESTCDELASVDKSAADSLRAYHEAIAARKNALLLLLKEGEEPEKARRLALWPATPKSGLQNIIHSLEQKVTEITSAAKPDEYLKLKAKVSELKGRKALNLRKADIEKYVMNARRNAELDRAISTLRTQEITRQGTAIIKKNLTPELLKALKDELKLLGATRIPISVKPSGASGEAAHEMLLEGANPLGRVHVSQILSEGEARVIAIAGFLAELHLTPHAKAIVFDDPASSLDHVYTGNIASRLAKEGLMRQVIIFTHNIGFLMELHDSIEALAKSGTPVPLEVHTLRRDGKSAGITLSGAPWHASKVKDRVKYLETFTNEFKPQYSNDKQAYNEKAARAYGLLREAWEACVEEDLFYSVVCRYRNSVKTMSLYEVSIEDSDIHQLDLHMTKASTWMTGHDKSKGLHEDRPSPDELLADICALREYSVKIIKRRGETRKLRKMQLKPKPSMPATEIP